MDKAIKRSFFNKKYIDQRGEYVKGKERCWLPGIKFILKNFLTRNLNEKINVLDLGCGDGSFFNFLLRKALNQKINIYNISFYGVDKEKIINEEAKNQGAIFFSGDILDLPKKYKNFFDFIICSEVLEHLEDTDGVFDTIKMVIKNDGYLFLTTPNLASYHGRFSLLMGCQPLTTEVSNREPSFGKGFLYPFFAGKHHVCAHHVRVFTYKALKDMLRFYNFEIIECGGGGYRFGENLLWRFLPWLAPFNWIIARNIKKKNINE